MTLSFESHFAGDIAVVKCSGRIVEGAESTALQEHVRDLLVENPYIILHLGEIEFIDSSGLGLLLRCLMRAQNARGDLKVCAASSRISEALKITKLQVVLGSYESEAEAVAALYRHPTIADRPVRDARILCVEQSGDVMAYVRELLRQAGYAVIATDNLPDALILLTATRPQIVIISSALRSARGTRAADSFNRLADALAVVELQPGFSSRDAGEAGRQLLDQVSSIVGAPNNPHNPVR